MLTSQQWILANHKSSDFFEHYLSQPDVSWSIGTHYIRGEFMRVAQEPLQIQKRPNMIEASTARGAMRIQWTKNDQGVVTTTAHNPSNNQSLWSHCWRQPGRPHTSKGLQSLGQDRHAIRQEDRNSEIFDSGLGLGRIHMYIRTRDTALARLLKRHSGSCLFSGSQARELNSAILQSQPHRVVVSPIARIEIYQPIPHPGEPTPDGPHTHIFPPCGEHAIEQFRYQQLRPSKEQDMLCLHTPRPLADPTVICISHPQNL